MPIHEKLKNLRREKNLSQLNVAQKLHISQNAYSLIECGKTKLDEQRIFQLSKIFNVHPFDLINNDLLNIDHPNNDTGKISYITMFNSVNRELILNLREQIKIKDDQIDKLIIRLEQLSYLVNYKLNPPTENISVFESLKRITAIKRFYSLHSNVGKFVFETDAAIFSICLKWKMVMAFAWSIVRFIYVL